MFHLVDAPSEKVHENDVPHELMGFNSPEGVVSTGVTCEGYVYIGKVTANEIGVLFGMVSADDAARLRAVILSQGDELAALRERLADLDPIVKAIRNVAAELAPVAA